MYGSLLPAKSQAKKRTRMQVDEMVEMHESVHAVRAGRAILARKEKSGRRSMVTRENPL
jgi:hypothetical protein